MNYELAKKLKEAGFPQKYEPICEHQMEMAERGEYWDGRYVALVHMKKCDRPGACSPTLSELIEACGDNFGGLNRLPQHRNLWHAWSNVEESTQVIGVDENGEDLVRPDCIRSQFNNTPEEAVANLWLELHSVSSPI